MRLSIESLFKHQLYETLNQSEDQKWYIHIIDTKGQQTSYSYILNVFGCLLLIKCSTKNSNTNWITITVLQCTKNCMHFLKIFYCSISI